MSTPSPLAKRALRHLADELPSIVPPSDRDANAAIEAIARELESLQARKRRRRVVALACAVAASIVIAVGAGRVLRGAHDSAVVSEVSGGVLVTRGNDGTTAVRGAVIEKGDRIVASAAGRATLVLRRGTELRASGGADLVVAEYSAAEVFDLRAGSIELEVAKLAVGERFIVRTNDAEVEVRGTRFHVDAGGEHCNGTTTRVKVTEGIVVVRHGGTETSVRANESWPAECPTAAAAPTPSMTTPAPMVESTNDPIAAAPRASARPKLAVALPLAAPANASSTAATAPIPSSELAEQNRLYADAMAAKRRGEPANALASLDRLLTSHPHGPLAESAAVERMRILAATDPSRASEAARAYLARYPNGHARDEAKKLAGDP
jgi:hypothetical protein